jgi:hypothetical protein
MLASSSLPQIGVRDPLRKQLTQVGSVLEAESDKLSDNGNCANRWTVICTTSLLLIP